MTEIWIDSAEEEFLAGNLRGASEMAHLAKDLDPFFGSVDRYVAAYDINVAAMKMTASGERNWYEVLGIQNTTSVTVKDIIDAYNRLVKLVHPEFHCSAAAKRAYRMITQALETLADSKTRLAYDVRSGLIKQRQPDCAAGKVSTESSRSRRQTPTMNRAHRRKDYVLTHSSAVEPQ